jgi:hypothetical protein
MSLESVIGTLVKRLESVTTRLEAIEKQVGAGGGSAPSAPSVAASSGGSSASVNDFEDLISGAFKAYVAAANKLGGDLTAQVSTCENGGSTRKSFQWGKHPIKIKKYQKNII